MKKIMSVLILVLLLIGRTPLLVSASPNTGQLPDKCEFKIDFNENGSIKEFTGDWNYSVDGDIILLELDEYSIEIKDMVFKDREELIGFTWSTSDNIIIHNFWVKHGQTETEYSSTFITNDSKGISNVVFCGLEEIEEEDELDDEDENDDDNGGDDDNNGDNGLEEGSDDEEEVVIEEPIEEEEEETIIEEEEEVLIPEEEQLPNTGVGLPIAWMSLGLGSLLLTLSRKKKKE